MRTVTFVTNRPAVTGGFGPPPPVGTPEMLTFGTAAIEPSPDPARAGRLAGPLTLAGACDCSVPGTDAPLLAVLTQRLTAAARAAKTPIVMVHGYSYSFMDALIRTADTATWFEATDFPVDLDPILFTWPSIDGLTPENYLSDRGRAQASANALNRFIIAFAAAWRASGQPRAHYLAHSMGTWATQNGMRALAAGAGNTLPDNLFEQAVIMGGDADTNALELGQGLDQLARLSEFVSVGVNRTDFATGVTSADILKRPRLGSSGPTNMARLPDNVRIIDYTLAIAADRRPTPPGETDWNYKLHQYYRTNLAVRDDIAAMLSGGDPDQIDNRITSAQMKQAGQVGIQPGRLYLRPAAPAPGPAPDQDVPERRG